MTRRARFLIGLLWAGLLPSAVAQEFRSLNPIPTPPPRPAAEGAFLPVDPDLIRRTIEELFAAWNTPRLLDLLGPDFYEAQRLVETLSTQAPRDARLRVLAIEAMTTLDQTVEPGVGGAPDRLASTVSAIVRSQLEFNDPQLGFQARDGVNEFIFQVKGPVPR